MYKWNKDLLVFFFNISKTKNRKFQLTPLIMLFSEKINKKIKIKLTNKVYFR